MNKLAYELGQKTANLNMERIMQQVRQRLSDPEAVRNMLESRASSGLGVNPEHAELISNHLKNSNLSDVLRRGLMREKATGFPVLKHTMRSK